MDGLVLDYESHTYRFDGHRVAGVGEVLAGVGITDTRWFTDWARDRGTAIHMACEYLVQGRLDWSTVDERIKPYVEAAALFIADAKVQAGPDTHVERPVWHPELRYAGTPDLDAICFGDEAIADWKSGGLGFAHLTTAAYEWADRASRKRKKPKRRIGVQLLPTGKYKKTDFTAQADYVDWLYAVSLYNKYIFEKRKD